MQTYDFLKGTTPTVDIKDLAGMGSSHVETKPLKKKPLKKKLKPIVAPVKEPVAAPIEEQDNVVHTKEPSEYDDVMLVTTTNKESNIQRLYISPMTGKTENITVPCKEDAEKASARVKDIVIPAVKRDMLVIAKKYGRGKMTKARAIDVINLKLKEANALMTMNKLAILAGSIPMSESLESNHAYMVKAIQDDRTSVLVDLARRLVEAADKTNKGANAYV